MSLKISNARKMLAEEEAAKLINEDDVRARALENAEQNGIVFLDEIDKVARRSETSGRVPSFRGTSGGVFSPTWEK